MIYENILSSRRQPTQKKQKCKKKNSEGQKSKEKKEETNTPQPHERSDRVADRGVFGFWAARQIK
jgi:hypothetical protein